MTFSRVLETVRGRVLRSERARKLRRSLDRTAYRLLDARRSSGGDDHGDFASRTVWLFGAGRTGSTWLAQMMRDFDPCDMWDEPYVGHMLGSLYYEAGSRRHDSEHFVLGGNPALWRPHVRRFVLDTAASKFPRTARDPSRYLVIKEPHGSVGAPLISDALPESRLLLLVREPRDAVASRLDARRPGGWSKKRDRYEKAGGNEDAVVESMSRGFMREMGRAVEAYRAHEGPKTQVRYEELRAEPATSLRRACSELGMGIPDAEVSEVARRHAWENVPEKEKGRGKVKRKATPGGWKDDLTAEQARIVEEVCGGFMAEFGYRRAAT